MTSQTYNFSYTYNLDGSLASQTYPSGRVVDFTYDASGRPYAVGEAGGGASYLNSVAYAAHGGIDNKQLGNQLTEQTCYNDLLQPTARRLGNATSVGCAVQTASDLLHLGFGYGAATQNNGNMVQQTIWAPDNGSGQAWQVTQDYTYDQVNRLATSAEKLSGATQWTRSYSYDHFGNRWISGATGHTLHMATPTSQSAIQASTNRLTGAGIVYDNAGNLTAHPNITTGSGSMAYDANNKMTAFAKTGVSVATTYDAAARRVRKVYNSETTVWVYDAFGKLAAEYTTDSHTDVATYFRTTDHLGSTRLTTDAVGDVVARRDFFPFGERIDSNLSGRSSVLDGTLVSFNSSPGMRQEFTGQQRDEETGLDYFWERCFCPTLARFFSVDPQNAGAGVARPQGWNGYTYVDNSPLKFIDPSGRGPIFPSSFGNCEYEYDEETGISINNPFECDFFYIGYPNYGILTEDPADFAPATAYQMMTAVHGAFKAAQRYIAGLSESDLSKECRDGLGALGISLEELQEAATSLKIGDNSRTLSEAGLPLAAFDYPTSAAVAGLDPTLEEAFEYDATHNIPGLPRGVTHVIYDNSGDRRATVYLNTPVLYEHELTFIVATVMHEALHFGIGALTDPQILDRLSSLPSGDFIDPEGGSSQATRWFEIHCIPAGGP